MYPRAAAEVRCNCNVAKAGEDADLSMMAGYKMFLDEKVTFRKNYVT